jgi:hypothetical protein
VEDRVTPIGGIDFSQDLDDHAVMEMQRRNRVLFAMLMTLRMRPIADDVGPESLAEWNTLRIQGAMRVLEEELYTGPELVAMAAITPAELARFAGSAPGLAGRDPGARERGLIDQLGTA